jgi:hypothetical protein
MDLQSLKNRFMAIQSSQSSFKLSERTVVEILNKIAKRGKVKLLHTITGKEYVVDGKVNFEILEQIKKHKRISTAELSKILELPINIIEKKTEEVLQKNKNLTSVDGKIMTNEYLNKITNEIISIIETNGSASIADLSNKFELSIDFMKKLLKEKVSDSSIKNAKLYPTRIITDYYIELETKKIRPALIASITPINISNITTKYNIDEMLINDIIDNLIKEGELKGEFRSNQYESALFSSSQDEYLKGELLQNNYIDYSKLKNIGITQDGEEYLKNLAERDNDFSEGVFLQDYLISGVLKNNFEGILNDNLNKNLPLNYNSVFFFDIDKNDSDTLLDSIGMNPSDFIYKNNNIISNSIIDNFVNENKENLKEIASKVYNDYLEKMEKIKKEKEKEKEDEKEEKKKNKKRRKDKKGKEQNEENDFEIDIELKKKDIEVFKNKILSNHSFDDLNDKNETLSVIFDMKILPKLNKIFSNHVNEFIKEKKNAPEITDKNTLLGNIDSNYLYLKLVQKNLDVLSSYGKGDEFERAIKAIIAYFSKKEMTNLLKDILIFQIIHMKLKLNTTKLNTHTERNSFIGVFPDDEMRDLFNNLNDCIQNKNLNKFVDLLTENEKNIAVSLPIYDKKAEKTQIEKFNKEIHDIINDKIDKIDKLNYKNYLDLFCAVCNYAMSKKGFHLRLPSEQWVINIYFNLLEESNLGYSDIAKLIYKINSILNNPKEKNKQEDLFDDNQEDLSQLLKEIYDTINK